MTNSEASSRIRMSVKSSKAPFGSVAPQPPHEILDVKSGFTLNVPFVPNNTPNGSTPDYVGTIPDGITPNPDEDLYYQGGYTIQDLNFANIYVGGHDWDPSDMQNIDSALSAAMSDPTLNGVMSQYFSGTVTSTFLGSAALPGYAPRSVSGDDVEAYLTALDKAGYLSDFSLDNTVLNFMLPSGTVLTDGSANSLNGLGGFHGSVHAVNSHGGTDTIYFTVCVYGENQTDGSANGIPVFDQSWKNVVGAFYHELNEARTDPDVEDASRYNNISYLGWVSDSGNEVGDYPVSEADSAGLPLTSVFCEVPLYDGSGTVPIQLMWSNQAHAPVNPTGHAIETNSPDDGWDWYSKFD
jgi:hypothetical protein